MKSEELLRALSFVDEKYIEEAAEGTAADSDAQAEEQDTAEDAGLVKPEIKADGPGLPERKTEAPNIWRNRKMIRIGSAIAAALVLGLGIASTGGMMGKSASQAPSTPDLAPPQAAEAMTDAIEESKAAASEVIGELKMADDPGDAKAEPEAPAPAPADAVPGESANAENEGGVTVPSGSGELLYTASAEYPDQTQYPQEPGDEAYQPGFDWDKYYKERNEQMELWQKERSEKEGLIAGASEGLDVFAEKTMRVFLKTDEGKNLLYSPVNVHMVLSMLAETTGGESRAQILSLLGFKDIEALRAQAQKIWLASYNDDGRKTILPGTSVWLDDQLNVKTDILDRLAENYHASSFVGDLQADAVRQAFRDWLSEMTKGLLDEHINNLQFSDQLRTILASTLYYKASWTDSFNASATREDTFHGFAGDEQADFMERTARNAYFDGEGFRAVSLGLNGGDQMRIVLPDEGRTASDVLASDALYDYLAIAPGAEGSSARVHLRLPRFDVDSSKDLIEGLRELGVTDVFDDRADFTPLSDDPLCVDQIEHAVRVKADEDGVEAAAYTVIMVKATSAMPEEPIEFTVDRPFIFEIISSEGLPLFTGVVNHLK
ncbi:MAG: hypothetical protein II499_09875 [Firmicutes bacterium]|nr:hypothetical protein [Bacillota bacterium]